MQTTSCTTYIFASNLHIQTQRKGLRAPQPFWPSGKRILIAQWCFYSPFPWQFFMVGWLDFLCVCLVLVLICLHGTTDSPGSKKILKINSVHTRNKSVSCFTILCQRWASSWPGKFLKPKPELKSPQLWRQVLQSFFFYICNNSL